MNPSGAITLPTVKTLYLGKFFLGNKKIPRLRDGELNYREILLEIVLEEFIQPVERNFIELVI